ncbi:hypothetical protein [Chryseobacterium polytrichastri]|uniref:Uncharacterized protein n=1 Tax=Chryseobacterium polytrichastri TaxID=1302687 RepID=A0A1M7F0H2_9FLAO|nr:hypothetical protein [Chryseobacterium polytrichastri]SHL97416.1 hypothetical protein SAMN05444267_10307 [Chryseobacterium polytrichastri]
MRTKKALRYSEQKIKDIEKAVSRFSQQFMSNSKWIRLIEAIVDNTQEIKKIQNNRIGHLYLNEDSIFEFDYWQTGFEGNNSFNDWLEYKEIEYLIFPKLIDSTNIQDLENIQLIIEKIGQFHLEMDENELKLICYKI